jgi:hypothetical protein
VPAACRRVFLGIQKGNACVPGALPVVLLCCLWRAGRRVAGPLRRRSRRYRSLGAHRAANKARAVAIERKLKGLISSGC